VVVGVAAVVEMAKPHQTIVTVGMIPNRPKTMMTIVGLPEPIQTPAVVEATTSRGTVNLIRGLAAASQEPIQTQAVVEVAAVAEVVAVVELPPATVTVERNALPGT
jgi:hypothetical protein